MNQRQTVTYTDVKEIRLCFVLMIFMYLL